MHCFSPLACIFNSSSHSNVPFFSHFSRPSDNKAPADGGIQTLRRVREASLHRAAEGDQTERKSRVGQRRQGARQAFHGKANVSLGQASNKAEEPDGPGLPWFKQSQEIGAEYLWSAHQIRLG